MAYTTPSFNLLADIWDCKFPSDDVADWTNVPCQKYILSRMSLNVTPQSAANFWRQFTPPISLRFPRTHAAFSGIPSEWTHAVVEVPAGSGQYYRSYWFEIQHQGFPNEYAIILATPCSMTGLAIPPPVSTSRLGDVANVCPFVPAFPSALLDDMNGPTGTNLTAHPMDIGLGWHVPSGSVWELGPSALSAWVDTPSSGNMTIAYAYSSLQDGWVAGQWLTTATPATDYFAVIARVIDEDNYYALTYDGSGSQIQLFCLDAGGITGYAAAAITPVLVGENVLLKLTVSGSGFTGYFENLLTAYNQTVNLTDSTHPSGLGWGIAAQNNAHRAACFDFEVHA